MLSPAALPGVHFSSWRPAWNSTPNVENGEGRLAGSFTVVRLGANAAASRDPAKRDLLAKKEALEQAIDKLKYDKAALPAAEYKRQLAGLLLELAKTQEALDKP